MGASLTAMLPHGRRHVVAAALIGAGGVSVYFKEIAKEEPVARRLMAPKEEETMEEKVMKNRFEEWMIKYGRTYEDKEEKAMRYELFKRTAQRVDKSNARGSGCTFDTNDFADRTREELHSSC